MSIINEGLIKVFISEVNHDYDGKLSLSYVLLKDCGVLKISLSKEGILVREIARKLNMRRTHSTKTIQENNVIALALIGILHKHARSILNE